MYVVEIGAARSPRLLTIHLDMKKAFIGREPVALSWNEWLALEHLAWCAGKFVSRKFLHASMHGGSRATDENMVTVAISRLARRLAESSEGMEFIDNIRHEGYVLRDPSGKSPRFKQARSGVAGVASHIRGRMVIDLESKTVRIGKEPLPFAPREYDVIACMGTVSNRVVQPRELLRQMYGENVERLDPQSVNVHVHRARTRLAGVPQHDYSIENIRSIGYVLRGPEVKILSAQAA